MYTPSLPVEIQVIILEHLFRDTRASSDHVSPITYPESPVHNFPFAAAFLAARTAAPAGPLAQTTPWSTILPSEPIEDIGDVLVLRLALAAAIPIWRDALHSIPALWTRIAVSVDKRTWGPEVLDAVIEALACAKMQALSILITSGAAEKGEEKLEGGTSKGTDNGHSDSEEDERGRIAQVMVLLAPHIKRWRYLRVCTKYPGALPMPTIDFAGETWLLEELHLRAALPAPTDSTIIAAPGSARTLYVPRLHTLTIDAHAFRWAYLQKPYALPAVHTLTVCGPGFNTVDTGHAAQADTSPVMSVQEVLACAGQIFSLGTLRLDGLHLSVEDWQDEEDDVALDRATSLHCLRLSAAVLEKILELDQRRWRYYLDDEDDELDSDVTSELVVVECVLPKAPCMCYYTHIELVRIAAGQDIISFLEEAFYCVALTVVDCTAFDVAKLSMQRNPWRDGRLTPHGFPRMDPEDWLVPYLEELVVDHCKGVGRLTLRQALQERKRRWPKGYIYDLCTATLDGQLIWDENETDDEHSDLE